MTATANQLLITSPTFYRVIDLNTRTYQHRQVVAPVKKKGEDSTTVAEIVYPQGRIVCTKMDKNDVRSDQLIIQNQTIIPVPKTKKRLKRAILAVEQDKMEDRYFEDGSIHHTIGSSSSNNGLCKISILEKEDGGQELTVSFTTTISPPVTAQAASTSQAGPTVVLQGEGPLGSSTSKNVESDDVETVEVQSSQAI